MKRIISIIITTLIYGAIFTSCSKESDDEILLKLKGSKWEAKITADVCDVEGKIVGTAPVLLSLHFIDDYLCTIGSGRMDNTTYSTSLTEYTWRYGTTFDSMWGQFHLYNPNSNTLACSGSIEKGKLFLVFYSEGLDYQSHYLERKK